VSMRNCHECKTEVSSEAKACPKCGAPVKKASSLGTIFIVVLVGTVGLMILSSMSGPSDYSAPSQPAKTSTDGRSTEKSVRAQTLVLLIKKAARNPDSVKIESIIVTDDGSTCATYRAQNGFGGMNREQAVLSADQQSVKNTSSPGFQSLWNAECANKSGLDATVLFNR
jgi:hypothetical protein